MKNILLFFTLFTVGCTSYLTPEETVNENIIACQEGDADTRWELSSHATQEKLLKDNNKDEILDRFRKEVFMYKLIKSWKVTPLEQTDKEVTMKLDYKFFDPHSKKIKDESTEVKLVKENQVWKICDTQ